MRQLRQFGGWFLIDSIGTEGLGGFLRQIDGLGSFGLHPKSEFVAGSTGSEFSSSRMRLEVFGIELSQEIELLALGLPVSVPEDSRSRIGVPTGRNKVPWNEAGIYPFSTNSPAR